MPFKFHLFLFGFLFGSICFHLGKSTHPDHEIELLLPAPCTSYTASETTGKSSGNGTHILLGLFFSP